MAEILLVHGSCHGAWCWRDLIPELEALGHRARAIDLPSHGEDTTPLADVTLDRYAQAILGAMEGPSVVVGHSMAGYPITRAADLDASNVAGLVYLCAYVPKAGLTLAERRREAPRQPLMHAVRLSDDRRSFTIDPEKAEAVFYHDCPSEAVAYAIPRLGPQAVLPQETAFDPRGIHVPRHYVRCTDDRTIPPEFQEEMTADWPRQDISEMPVGHSPFFADPAGLAAILDHVVRK
ncbi:Pimeloyl-ACP methyl ester carboxylesterase [Poseidonocella pacifica]|uniref:Pimeloyl-ACP methyl ester carboxylesterase n=1 Tax=Poseidonocella pacifica TaxID=871651 RepID=A0A1I0WI92_9RHOB|nr:alpha/beta fold hydrolase [Poseidonocella pacifica]SFA88505.1 Pimeloyl-ACP methyl ester carboxylesterase [Poseidonocella pacifica]